MKALLALWKNDEGASLVEYALLVALIAVVALAAIKLLGTNASTVLNSAGTAL
ncbi:MAG: Flp family type IVb pilin [Vulcanimicrobiaceae bacterium]